MTAPAWPGDRWELPNRDEKIATGMGDPVLVRLTTDKSHLLLLAEDASHDKAGIIRLFNVRLSTAPRGWMGLFASRCEPALHRQINLRPDEKTVVAGISGMATLRVLRRRKFFVMVNLSRVEHEAMLSASPRRLLMACRRERPAGRRSLAAMALVRLHRLRFSLGRLMSPAALR